MDQRIAIVGCCDHLSEATIKAIAMQGCAGSGLVVVDHAEAQRQASPFGREEIAFKISARQFTEPYHPVLRQARSGPMYHPRRKKFKRS